jgi:hypothetical protein
MRIWCGCCNVSAGGGSVKSHSSRSLDPQNSKSNLGRTVYSYLTGSKVARNHSQ